MFKRKRKKDQITFREALNLFFLSAKKVWKEDKKYVIFTCFVLLLGTIPDLLGAFAAAVFNQRIISGVEEYALYYYTYRPLLIAFIVSIANLFFFYVWRWVETKSKDKMTAVLLRESVKKASMIDYASYDNPEFYDRIQKGWSQDGEMFINSTSTIITSISNVVGMAAYISILTYVDWKLLLGITVLRLCFTPIETKVYVMNYQLNNKLAELRREEQYYCRFFGNKGMSSEGKIFHLYDYAKEHYAEVHRKIYKATFIHKIKVSGLNLLSSIMSNFPITAGYIYLSVCVFNGSVSLANMTLFISLYVGFVDQLYNTISDICSFRGYAEQSRFAREFLAIPTCIFADDDQEKIRLPQSSLGHTVEFCNVTFAYPGTSRQVLRNISFRSKKNETISIVGLNGAGKTTLIYLLMRLYDPSEGVILLDGRDIREYSVEDLYALYGTLFQDYCNYAVSGKEAISLSSDTIKTQTFSHSLKASTVYKFIYTLPDGINTPLSRTFQKEGVELSVGQAQRVALARAYYKDAPIVILDEPSASIDPESEAEILEAVNEMKGKKNIWIISHRLSTCLMSDRVLFLKDGMLIGNGSHDELMRSNAEYKRMFFLQAAQYGVMQ